MSCALLLHTNYVTSSLNLRLAGCMWGRKEITPVLWVDSYWEELQWDYTEVLKAPLNGGIQLKEGWAGKESIERNETAVCSGCCLICEDSRTFS